MEDQIFTLGKKIYSFRKINNLTAKSFIKLLNKNISTAYLTKIELHNEIPSPDLICKVASIINYPAETLLKEVEEIKTTQYKLKLDKKYSDALKAHTKVV